MVSLTPDSAAAVQGIMARGAQPPGVIVLQLAAKAAAMQEIMVQAAKDLDERTLEQRIKAGRPPLSRGELEASIDVMLSDSKLESLRLIVDDAADTLRGVKIIAEIEKGEMSRDELLLMAKQYSRARGELRKAFEGLPEKEQALANAFNRDLAAVDYAEGFYGRARALSEEEEKVRLARARIAQENAQLLTNGPPEARKTLAELEEANAKFDQPVVSLYAQPRQRLPCSSSSGCL